MPRSLLSTLRSKLKGILFKNKVVKGCHNINFYSNCILEGDKALKTVYKKYNFL